MTFSLTNFKQILLLATFVFVNSLTHSLSQTTPQSLNIYEDEFIRARGLSLLARDGMLNYEMTINLLIQNKSGKNLFIGSAKKTNGSVTVTSNSGEGSQCRTVKGLEVVDVKERDPFKFTKLIPNGQVTVSVSYCPNITPSATSSIDINMPLVVLGESQNIPITLNLIDIQAKRNPNL